MANKVKTGILFFIFAVLLLPLVQKSLPFIKSKGLDGEFTTIFASMMQAKKKPSLRLDHSTGSIVSYLMHHCTDRSKHQLDQLYPELCIF